MLPFEYHTYQFYAWESRGRGWLCFEEPVCLEPPFIPFIRQFPRTGYIDESKKPTWLSSFIDSVKGKKQEQCEEEELLDYDTITPFEYTGTHDLQCLIVKIPKKAKANFEAMKAFLSIVSQTNNNVSYELFGNSTEIILQFVTSREDSNMVKTFLATYFPDYTIQSNNRYLEILPPNTLTHMIDFGLKEEFVRPISMVKNLTIDPLTSIFGILDALQEGEFAGIQILFQGAVNNWKGSMMRAVSTSDGKSFFADAPEAPKITQEKVTSSIFGVCIRAFSQEKKGQTSIIQSLSRAVVQASSSPYNELMPMFADVYSNQARVSDIYLRESHRLGMLLSADELTTLLHFPSENIQSKKLHGSTRKTISVPSIAKNKNMVLGMNTHEGVVNNVTYSTEDRLKHTHIIGATGTGKSTLIAQMILQDCIAGYGIALFDPHGDLVDDVLAHLQNKVLDRIVVIDPSDSNYPIGLNLLDAHSDIEKEVLSSDLVASFKRLSTSWGDQMNTVLANAILALLESTEVTTLNDLRRFLVEAHYRHTFLKNIQDPSIKYYWEREYPLLKTNSIGPILTRLDTFLRPRIIRNMVSQKKGLDFDKILNGNKILLVKLPQGIIGRENSYLLGSLILSKLHQASFARQSNSKRPPFFIYLDEFHNFITPSIKEMLSGVRKYNVGLVLSHQDLQQIQREDTELLNSVLGNTYTRIVFRVGEPDAKKLQDGFADFDFTDMQNLGIGEALMRIEQPRYNTTFDTIPLEQINSETREDTIQHVLEYSRSHYAQPKDKIEKELIDSFEAVSDSILQKKQIHEQDKEKDTIPAKVEAISVNPILPSNQAIVKPATEIASAPQENVKSLSTHKYLQNLIKRFAESQGYVVTLEAPLAVGDGNIDLLLYKDNKKIAIEICITTEAQWEVHNIKKCINTNIFDNVISLCGDSKQLEKIKNKYKELHGDYDEVLYFTPDVLFEYLQKDSLKENENSTTETSMKGYRINVNYDSISPTEMKHKKSSIASVILSSINKKK